MNATIKIHKIFFMLLIASYNCFSQTEQRIVISNNNDSIKMVINVIEEQSNIKKSVDSLNAKFISDNFVTVNALEKSQKFYDSAFKDIQSSYSNFLTMVAIIVAIAGVFVTGLTIKANRKYSKAKKYNEEIKKEVDEIKKYIEIQKRESEEIKEAFEIQKKEFKEITEAFINLKEEKIEIETQGKQKGKIFKETQVQKSINKIFNNIIRKITDNTESNFNIQQTTKQSKNIPNFTDHRDGNIYSITKIGNQTWMAENLRYSMPEITYNFVNNEVYYNLKTAIKACPSGWRLPSMEDWEQLVNFCSGVEVAGKKLKAKNCDGTDEFGFSAYMYGYYINKIGFNFIGKRAIWWTSTELNSKKSYVQCIDGEKCYKYENGELNENMFSIRCIKNES